MKFIGIDPGISGGVGIVSDKGLEGYFPMPGTRKQLYDALRPYAEYNITCTIEKVGVMPKQGISSSGKFMKGYGEVLGICTALGFKILEPTPQAWKKEMLAGTDKSKDASIQRCENLFPTVNLILPRCRKPHDGIAEAILMAAWGQRQP